MKLIYKSIALTILFLCKPVTAENKFKQVGDSITRSVDLVFKENPELTFRLTTKPDLKAGFNSDNSPVAFFNITAKSPMNLGIRWTPNSGTINKDYRFSIRVPGKNNPKNQIQLSIIGYHETAGYIVDGDQWSFLSEGPVKEFAGVITIEGDQSVISDTYTISLDAAAFIS